MNKFSILTGDAFNVLDTLPAQHADIIYTSPNPYYHARGEGTYEFPVLGSESNTIDYMRHLLAIIEKAARVLKPKGSLWLQMPDYHGTHGSLLLVPEATAINLCNSGWLLTSSLIWVGNDRPQLRNRRYFVKDWEYLYCFTRAQDYYFNETFEGSATSVLYTPARKPANNCESSFPEELVNVAIQSTVPPNGTILDIFAGSGTTGMVALKAGCYFIGIEIDEIKAEMIRQRLAKLN